jgi:hypothetical protein
VLISQTLSSWDHCAYAVQYIHLPRGVSVLPGFTSVLGRAWTHALRIDSSSRVGKDTSGKERVEARVEPEDTGVE